MNKIMNMEIQKMIKKNLPAEVGDILKIRLEDAKQDAATVIAQKIRIEGLEKSEDKLNTKLAKHVSLEEKEKRLKTLNFQAEEKARNQKVFEAELKASAAEARANEMLGLVQMVFRSPVFRKTISESTMMTSIYSTEHCKNIDVPHKTTIETIDKD